jgi:hypothetical protein
MVPCLFEPWIELILSRQIAICKILGDRKAFEVIVGQSHDLLKIGCLLLLQVLLVLPFLQRDLMIQRRLKDGAIGDRAQLQPHQFVCRIAAGVIRDVCHGAESAGRLSATRIGPG